VTLIRHLDRYEVAHLNAPTAFVTECVGELDDVALAGAYRMLCQRYPALHGRVWHDGHGYVLDSTNGAGARFRSTWMEDDGYPRDIAAEWDVGHSLSAVIVERQQGKRARVALYLDHCVGDGKHMYALCKLLWRLYADIVAGTRIATPLLPPSLPDPPLTVLSDRLGAACSAPTLAGPVSAALPTLRYRRSLLTAADTAALVSRARAAGVSVYGLLAAAVVGGQRALLGEMSPTTIWAVVDLRARVEPQVGPTDTTNFASAVTVEATSTGVVPVARDVRATVLAAIADREPHHNMLDDSVGDAMNYPRANLGAAIVSNLGAVPELTASPDLSIADFWIWPYGWRQRYPMYMASTYGGRLGIDMVFRADVYDDPTVDKVVDAVTSELTAARV
jgi:hypothetical protein